jgi:Septum formation
MTERDDTRMSSSDLLREAREQFLGASTTAPSEPRTRQTLDAEAAPTMAEAEEAGGPPRSEPPAGPVPDTPAGTSDWVLTNAPDRDTPRRRSRWSPSALLVRLIVPAVIFGGLFLYNTIDDTKSVESLSAGDCILEPGAEEITTIELKGCGEPHVYEVFATVTDPSPSDAAYPGVQPLLDSLMVQCLARYEAYIGVPFEQSLYWANAIYPTQESWSSGDRTGTCLVFEGDAGASAVTRTGSLRGSRS